MLRRRHLRAPLLALVGCAGSFARAAFAQSEPPSPPPSAPPPIIVVPAPVDAPEPPAPSVAVTASATPALPPALPPASATASASASVALPSSTTTEVEGALIHLPLRVGASAAVGFTSQLDGLPLDGSMAEYAGSLGWIAARWFSLEARVSYLAAMHRAVDANADGRADADPGAFSALGVGLAGRFRFFNDWQIRQGFSLSIGGGWLFPLDGAGTHAGGPVVEAAIARHVGVLTESHQALELGLELRARSGLGPTGDFQTLTLGVTGAWEGDQDRHRDHPRVVSSHPGYHPGHTFSVEGSGAVFFGDAGRQGTGIHFGATGGGIAIAGGLVLARPFELIGRLGYMGRAPASDGVDVLHSVFAEGGMRARWGWAFAELDGGVVAPFGTFRDRVATTAFAGGGLGVRIPLVDPEQDGTRLVIAARTRVGVLGESAFDALLLSFGVEWEGGGVHAPPFPRITVEAPVRAPEPAPSTAIAQANPAPPPTTTYAPGSTTTTVVPPTPVAPVAGYGGHASYVEPPRYRGPTYNTIPLGISAGFGYGFIAPVQGAQLQSTVAELAAMVSWTPAHWLAIDARGEYLWAAARTEDTNHDGRNDASNSGLAGVSVLGGARLRLLYDEADREGWTLGLYGGYLFPTEGFGTRPGGAFLEAALQRHIAVILASHNAFGLSLEARARQGLGDLADLQTLTAGFSGSWEGNVTPDRNAPSTHTGWLPGHTFALDAGGLAFLDGGRRANGARYFGDVGYTFGLDAGITFTPAFELGGRVGYTNRGGVDGVDDASWLTVEGGPRVRWGWLAARGFAGWAASFGTQRDEVPSEPYAGGSLEARWEIVSRWRVLLGVDARVGIGAERAFDQIGLRLGFEFEGGRNEAAPFPSAPPSQSPAPGASPEPPQSWSPAPGASREPPPSQSLASGGSFPPPESQSLAPGGVPTTPGEPVTTSAAPPTTSAAASASAHVAVDLSRIPLRFSLGGGLGVNNRGLHGADLDGMHTSAWLGVSWVPAQWFALDLTSALMVLNGHATDTNGDGRADATANGATAFTLTLGPRFRLLTDEDFRYGWSFGLAGGLLATDQGSGVVGEAVLGRHLATVGSNHSSFEIGLELRGRLGWVPGAGSSMGGTSDRGGDFRALTLGLAGAWEGNVSRRAPRNGYFAGETLSADVGAAVFLPYVLRNGVALDGLGLAAGASTGIVFAPAVEVRARGAIVARGAGDNHDDAVVLLAEGGPRFRWGWLYADVMGGYAGVVGTYRDLVAGSPTLALGVGARLGLVGPEHHFGVTLGVDGRVGLSDERAYDMLVAHVGFEFEGGRQQAAPFSPEVEQALRVANDVAQGRATVGFAASGSVGASAMASGAGSGPLVPGYTYDVSDVGRAGSVELDTDAVDHALPPITDAVRALRVTVDAPRGADAAATESIVRNAVALFYGGRVEVTVRVVMGLRPDRFALSIAAE